jgi:aldehyde dehydrogenase (NAD+)
VSASALSEVRDAVVQAVGEGCEVVAGGAELDAPGLDGGFYYAPTVLAGADPSMTIAQEEVFGPVLSVIEVDDDDEALAVANSTRYGLAAAAFTADERRIRRVLDEVNAGLVHINNPTPGAEPHVPFGGIMASSTQAAPEQGQTARDFFTDVRTAYIRPGG